MDSVQIIILAAGHGKRMNSNLPKVLLPVNGVPMIKHLLSAVAGSRIKTTPIIVVGRNAKTVMENIGDSYRFAMQAEQLGTGHAVSTAKDHIDRDVKHIMVLYGDHPLLSTSTIENIAETHVASGAHITMAITKIPDFSDWRTIFLYYGRIIRDREGKVAKIVENKDATPEEKQVREVNPAFFCFNAEWLWKNLEKLDNNNNQKEYYLTALPGLACQNGESIATVAIEPIEALGANTPEQLAFLEKIQNRL